MSGKIKDFIKNNITTLLKYGFSFVLILVTIKTTKDFKYILGGLFELIIIFGISNFLIKKSKWFNILNDLLMLIFNAELIVLLFASSFVTLVMLQSLTSVEDLQGKTVVYGLGVMLVLAFSFLPIKPIEQLDKIPNKVQLIALPILLCIDLGLIFGSSLSISPYSGAKDLYTQWSDYTEMKRMVAMYKSSAEQNSNVTDSTYDANDDYEYENDDYSNDYSKNNSDGNNAENSNNINNIEESDNQLADLENDGDTVSISDNSTDSLQTENVDLQTTENNNNVALNPDVVAANNTVSSNNTGIQTNPTPAPKGNGLDSKLAKQFPVGVAMPHNTLPSGTNVIVIFVEGLSNNVITDSRGIMPNLAAFKNESITFTNYYNHTFATYRGIQGQLYSGHSLDDYEQNHLPSMMDVLKANGYNTAFINVEPYNKDFTNYLKAMSFDKVISSKDEADNFAGSLSDRQAYSMLFDTAKDYQAKGKPFFLGLYSFGTHMSFDTDENVYGDGSNNFMNRYYNCDYQIGAFIENFKNSSLAKNTLLIITADHSAYADEDFVKTFPTYVRNHPACDQIPLYIYYNGLTSVVNAGGRNSLDLAPTILDLLGYNSPATFLGASLYGAKNESTILDSFFWNPDGLSYTGDGMIKDPSKAAKDFVNGEVIKYISIK